jgi:hypothetical protein
MVRAVFTLRAPERAHWRQAMCTPRRFHPEAFKFVRGDQPEAPDGRAEEADLAETLRLLESALASAVQRSAKAWAAVGAAEGLKASNPKWAREARRKARKEAQALGALKAQFEAAMPAGHAVRAEGELTVVEITARVRGGQFLMRPDNKLNEVAAGVIGRSQAKTGVRIGAVNLMSNCLAMVLAVRDPQQAADFTNLVFGQLADRVGRLRGLRGRMWSRRNRSIVVDGNPTDVGKCLKYSLSNGVKENLVAHPSEWPGLQSARLFVLGEPMVGKWTNYTAWGAAKRRDPHAPESDFQTEYEVVHSKMPCFEHMSDEAYRQMICGWCDEAAEEAAAVRAKDGLPAPGSPQRVTQVPFEHIPDGVSRSPAPAVHAHDPARRKQYRQRARAYREHLRAVRQCLADHASKAGFDLQGQGIPVTGWRPVDPATISPPPNVRLGMESPVTVT